jgi:hypothetical protein
MKAVWGRRGDSDVNSRYGWRCMTRYDHPGRARDGGIRRLHPQRASRAVRWIFGQARAWDSGKLVPAAREAHCQDVDGWENMNTVPTWTMAMVSGERFERRFSAKLRVESENQAGFLAGVAVVSTTCFPLWPMISV